YAEEIENENFKGRQDNDNTEQALVERKKSNQYDYADALIRYLRATQLISFDKNFRVIVSPARIAEVDYILETVDRDAFVYASERDYKNYLFSPNSLSLFTDLKANIYKRFNAIGVAYDKNLGIEELKNLLEEEEINRTKQKIKETETGLKHYKEFNDVEDVFSKIHDKIMPDPSLYLEWNVWRAMVMINFAQRVQGNFKIALDGLPLNTAGARLPDIEVDYDGFKLIVEVTMSSGQKQYDMEGEPVPRHFGVIKNATELPVYCLFIAPKISDGTLAHYFALNQKAPKFYGGQTNIIPMSVQNFRTFITTARDRTFNNPNQLKSYLDNILAANRKLDDESIWFSQIQGSVGSWL
ncbi:MAG: AlwI family type II restriction endonuclease, partial [Stigonema ocellatum SAG 48.90 = DSM 106950]|nr:AlwI family type II restriction endonuclease [Stigonema ocellatum SAG 48.90 = DSM 106950]